MGKTEGGELAMDEKEKAKAGEVEKEGAVMAEEKRTEAREVGKEENVMYHCHQCGKSYAYMHKE